MDRNNSYSLEATLEQFQIDAPIDRRIGLVLITLIMNMGVADLRYEIDKYKAELCPESKILEASAKGTPPLRSNVGALQRTDTCS